MESGNQSPVAEAALRPTPFLQRSDWLSFGVTTLLMLAVYLFTLNPGLDLGYSGIFATGAMYPGVSDVPGYPLWTVYSWLFTVLLPFSNMAWRVNVAAAVAASLTCGVVALLTSRCGGALLNDLTNEPGQFSAKNARALRIACGCVAGMALGLDGAFWRRAVIAGPWTFSLLLFAITLAFLLRWQHAPEKIRWFLAAIFMFGITLTNSQALTPAAMGIEGFILCVKPSLARDVFAAAALLLAVLVGFREKLFPAPIVGVLEGYATTHIYIIIGTITLILAVVLGIMTRGIFTHWRTLLAAGALFCAGLTPYFLVPIFSMTNPPMNWGYPRTVEGFYHVITRGQFERANPAANLGQYATALHSYGIIFCRDFGLIYALCALIPFVIIHRLQKSQRQWLFGLAGMFLSLSLLMVYLLNPDLDRASVELNALFWSASHLVLAMMAGCGLAIVGRFVIKPLKAPRGRGNIAGTCSWLRRGR